MSIMNLLENMDLKHLFQAKAFKVVYCLNTRTKVRGNSIFNYMRLYGLLFLVLIIQQVLWSQELQSSGNPVYRDRIVFYNVENLFDVFNDSLTNDDEYTPEGDRHWNNHKFYKKLNNLSKVIISIGEWNPPSVIGLCEIENRFVLNKLIYETPLKSFDYKIIHAESPDRRGIDVAFLYRKSRFNPLFYSPIPINFPDDTLSKTRDILYVKGVLAETDTVHFFVNHWPSRYGGYEDSKPRRMFVASVLRSKVDSILSVNYNPNIIIMGDFNDEPGDESIRVVLRAKSDTFGLKKNELVDLMGLIKKNNMIGTNKFQSEWSVIDQFICTGNLLTGKNGLKVAGEGASIYDASFLLEKDETNLGFRLNRTYIGPIYHGGFSDHLPIYLDLINSNNESGR
jgi:hypothetical protein